MKIDWSPRALSDYLAVLTYLQREWGQKATESFASRVDDLLNLIIAHPLLFSNSGKHGIRRCVITKQLSLYYRKKDDRIQLIAFIDNRSNPKKRRTGT